MSHIVIKTHIITIEWKQTARVGLFTEMRMGMSGKQIKDFCHQNGAERDGSLARLFSYYQTHSDPTLPQLASPPSSSFNLTSFFIYFFLKIYI